MGEKNMKNHVSIQPSAQCFILFGFGQEFLFRCIPNMLFYIIFSFDIDAFLCFIYYTVMPIKKLVFEHWQVFTCALRSWSRPSRPLKLGLCEWSEEMPSQLSVRYGVDRVSSAGRDGLNEQRHAINYTDKHVRARERESERESLTCAAVCSGCVWTVGWCGTAGRSDSGTLESTEQDEGQTLRGSTWNTKYSFVWKCIHSLLNAMPAHL